MSQRLGRYELLEQLGEGGMGSVWLARLTGSHGFEKLCIVKTVLPGIASDPQFVSRFLHEGRVLTQLTHSNIAQVYDMSEDGGSLFLALEYVAGVDLARLQQNLAASGQPMPVSVALYVMQQAAEGLGYAHRKAAHDGTPLLVVHRDVSPQNIMVSYEGEVKVIDFGIAKSEAKSRATAQATVMGKLGYMAPEQARGDPVDHRADQYACAVVLWELLANAPYIPRGTITEMVVAMTHPKLQALTALRPEVPASLEVVVLKALAAEPIHRFPSTDDFARALLDELIRSSGLPSKVQIGEYVRANCQGDYQAQQTLMTRVHTPTRPDATAPFVTMPQRPEVVAAPATPLEATTLRATSPGAPMTTGELSAAGVRANRAPVVIGLGLAVVAAVAGGAYFAWEPTSSIKEAPQTPVTEKPLGEVASPPAPPPTPAPAPEPPRSAEPAAAEGASIAPVSAPPRAGGRHTLRGTLKLQRTPIWSVTFTNTSGFAWSNCTVTIPGQKRGKLKSLSPGFSRELPLQYFTPDSSAPQLQDVVQVVCKEGSATLSARE